MSKEVHRVSSESGFKMTTEQRQRKLDRFMREEIKENPDNPSSSSCPLDTLDIPTPLKESLWKKAGDLARDESAIVQAPGDDLSWMVRSYSGKRPHYVTASKSSYACDDQCLSFKSMKVCSHTVALAIKTNCVDKFVRSYQTMKCRPNFTALAGKSSTAGKKPVRKGVSKKTAQQIRKFVGEAEESNVEWRMRGDIENEDMEGTSTSYAHPSPSFSSTSYSNPSSTFASTSYSPPTPTLVSYPQPISCAAGAFVMSQSDIHNINISHIDNASPGVVCSPPPLISMVPQEQRPFVDNPFILMFIFGNVSRCYGCKGKIARDVNKKALPPPNDLVMCHKEFVVFNNPRTGKFEQSRDKRNVYYHPWKTCIAPNFSDFNPRVHISVSQEVKEKLLPVHVNMLAREFGLLI